MQINDINKENKYNPRTISDKKLNMLDKSLKEYGDLSGIVLNVKSGRLIGGNQRIKTLDPSWRIIKNPCIDKLGTVANGYIDTPYGKFAYREVDWTDKKEFAANVAANHHGGEDDLPKLKDILEELDDGDFNMDLTGIKKEDIENLMNQFYVEPIESISEKTLKDNLIQCPKCGIKFEK